MSIQGNVTTATLAVPVKNDAAWYNAALLNFNFVAGKSYIIVATATLVWTTPHATSTISCVTNVELPGAVAGSSGGGFDFQKKQFPGIDQRGEYVAIIPFTAGPGTGQVAGSRNVRIAFAAMYSNSGLSVLKSEVTVLEGVNAVFPYLPPSSPVLPDPAGIDHLLMANTALDLVSTKLAGRVDPADSHLLQIQNPDGAWITVFDFGAPAHLGEVNAQGTGHYTDAMGWTTCAQRHGVASDPVKVKAGSKYLVTCDANVVWEHPGSTALITWVTVRFKSGIGIATEIKDTTEHPAADLCLSYAYAFIFQAVVSTTFSFLCEVGTNHSNMNLIVNNARIDIIELR